VQYSNQGTGAGPTATGVNIGLSGRLGKATGSSRSGTTASGGYTQP